MSKYRIKPLVLEAIQWSGDKDNIKEFTGQHCNNVVDEDIDPYKVIGISIITPEGSRTVMDGDWILKDVKGIIYSCKRDMFEKVYEKVE